MMIKQLGLSKIKEFFAELYFSLTGALVNKWLAFKGSFFNDVGEFNKIKLWICIIILYFLLRIVLVMIKMKNCTIS